MTAVPMETLRVEKNMPINLQRNVSCEESSARLLNGGLRNICGYTQPKHIEKTQRATVTSMRMKRDQWKLIRSPSLKVKVDLLETHHRHR